MSWNGEASAAVAGVSPVIEGALACTIDSVSPPEVPPPGVGLNTVTVCVPVEENEGMGAVSDVGDSCVVAAGAPSRRTTDDALKPVPVKNSVNAEPLTPTEEGESAVRVGAAFSTATEVAALVPPPGAGFRSVSACAPLSRSSAASTVALSAVALTRVAVRTAPSQSTSVPAMRPAAWIDSAVVTPPTSSVAGVTALIVGAGFTTVSDNGALAPPPGAGFVTTSDRVPVAVRLDAGTVTRSCVGVTSLTSAAVPLTSACEPATKPVPVTVTTAEIPFAVSV